MTSLLILAHGVTHGGPSTWDLLTGAAIDAAPYALAGLLVWGAGRAWRHRPIRRARRG